MSEATPLLATKLTIPSIRSKLVPRPRLSAQLEAGLQRRLILVVAPAGWGKSSLVSTWLHTVARHLPAAWVALDAADADLHRFWRYVVAALDRMYHGMSDSLLPLLQSPQPPGMEMVVTTLLNALSHHTTDAVLVLDDYHVIDNPGVHQSLQFLLDHLPRHLHVVLVTRMDPPLPLARWRAQGELIEIRALHLRFTRDEAAQFLKETMGLALGWEEIAALEARTEGWVAGLQLAALALRDREDVPSFISRFTGSNRFVLDYLVEEVVARHPPISRPFCCERPFLIACALRCAMRSWASRRATGKVARVRPARRHESRLGPPLARHIPSCLWTSSSEPRPLSSRWTTNVTGVATTTCSRMRCETGSQLGQLRRK